MWAKGVSPMAMGKTIVSSIERMGDQKQIKIFVFSHLPGLSRVESVNKKDGCDQKSQNYPK